jgi:hypothetical protein
MAEKQQKAPPTQRAKTIWSVIGVAAVVAATAVIGVLTHRKLRETSTTKRKGKTLLDES